MGHSGAGKDIAAKYLEKEHHCYIIHISELAKRTYEKIFKKPCDRMKGLDLASTSIEPWFRTKLLEAFIAEFEPLYSQTKRIVVCSLRNELIYDWLKLRCKKVTFVEIKANPVIRAKRKGIPYRKMCFFDARQASLLATDLKSDKIIVNEGTLTEFHHKLDELVADVWSIHSKFVNR